MSPQQRPYNPYPLYSITMHLSYEPRSSSDSDPTLISHGEPVRGDLLGHCGWLEAEALCMAAQRRREEEEGRTGSEVQPAVRSPQKGHSRRVVVQPKRCNSTTTNYSRCLERCVLIEERGRERREREERERGGWRETAREECVYADGCG